MASTDLDEKIETEEGQDQKVSHIVTPAHLVTEAYIMGTPVTALCGYTWVPTRDPERYPICPTCGDLMARILGTPD